MTAFRRIMRPAAVGSTIPYCCHVAATHALSTILEEDLIESLNQFYVVLNCNSRINHYVVREGRAILIPPW